jgi:hypothetical protein
MSKAAELANLIGNINAGGGGVNRNVIINGAMNVAQRGTSFASVSTGTYTLDRFKRDFSHDGNVTITQDSSAPDGFANSLKVDVTTADTSLAAGQYENIAHIIEAQNLQNLAFGTSDAKNITVSFYVKSNKTGTYAFNISQSDNSSKQATLNYTIDSANTWERKSLTFTGDTSGVINDDNGRGLHLVWFLAAGSTYNSGSASATFQTYDNANYAAGQAVNVLDSTDNTWFLTGCQLEIGQNETVFEHEPFERTLAKCQRYLQVSGADNVTVAGWGMTRAANNNFVSFPLVKALRATPTVSVQGGTVRFTAEGAQTEGSSNTIVINSVTPLVHYGNNSSNVVTLQYDGDAGPNTTINSQTIGFMVNSDVEILFASEL